MYLIQAYGCTIYALKETSVENRPHQSKPPDPRIHCSSSLCRNKENYTLDREMFIWWASLITGQGKIGSVILDRKVLKLGIFEHEGPGKPKISCRVTAPSWMQDSMKQVLIRSENEAAVSVLALTCEHFSHKHWGWKWGGRVGYTDTHLYGQPKSCYLV